MGFLFGILRRPLIGLGLLAMMAVVGGVAKADEVTFAGYTNGMFNGTPPNTSASQTTALGGLTYLNSTFAGTTANGILGIGGNPQNPLTGPQNLNNLGSFNLAVNNFTYNGNTFSLRVTFTLPPGINGSNSAIFSATLTGTVTSTSNGGVFIDFNNTPVLFTFSNPSATGSFLFSVNDLSIFPGQTAEITGTITAAQQTTVPEPASMLLLGTGLISAAGFARWRLRKS